MKMLLISLVSQPPALTLTLPQCRRVVFLSYISMEGNTTERTKKEKHRREDAAALRGGGGKCGSQPAIRQGNLGKKHALDGRISNAT